VSGEPEPDAGRAVAIPALGAHTLASRLAAHGLAFLTSILSAAAVGAAGRGEYILPVTMVTVGFVVAGLGLPQAEVRLWSRRAARPAALVASSLVLAPALGLVGVLGVLGAYALGRSSLFADVGPGLVATAVVALPLLVHTMAARELLMLGGHQRAANRARVIGVGAQTLVTALLFALGRLSVEAVVAVFAGAVALEWLLLVGALPRVGRPRGWPSRALLARQLRIAAVVAPAPVFTLLNLRADVFLVAAYLDLRAVGIYSVAVVFAELLWLVSDSLRLAIAHRQASTAARDALAVTLRAVRTGLVIAVGLGLVVAALAPWVVHVVFGEEFAGAGRLVLALLPAAVAMALWRPLDVLLLRLAPAWLAPAAAVCAAVVNVAANVVALPRLGVTGAAVASILSYWSGALVALTVLRRLRPFAWRELVPRPEDVRSLWSLVRSSSPGAARGP
jgi:O-antigen/teichoic acid export membrane protein